jgi:hypothetical protein
MVLAPLEIGPGMPAVPIIARRATASFAAFSRAWLTSSLRTPLDRPRADTSSGCCVSFCDDVVLLASLRSMAPPGACFGDVDTVVLVAVGGLSSRALCMAALDVEGSLPVSSSL